MNEHVPISEVRTEASVRVLRLTAHDNVGVATAELPAHDEALLDERTITVVEAIPRGHKVALAWIPKGSPVVKFGVNIGTTTMEIPEGAHVHVHNLESERMRGDRA